MRIVKLNLFYVLVCTSLIVLGCSNPEPCEEHNYGTVIIRNETGNRLRVDVTWDDIYINDERILGEYSTTQYDRVPVGRVEVWARIDLDIFTWTSNYISINACDNYTYTWHLD